MSWIDWDAHLFLWINGWAGSWLDYLFGWPSFLGTPLLAAVLFIYLWIWDRPRAIERFTRVSAGAAGGVLIAVIFKGIFERPRPFFFFREAVERGDVVVKMMFDFFSSNSFPSGHTAFAFAIATALCMIYGRKLTFTYLAALWMGLSRIYVGAHFPVDVASGAIFGTIGSFLTLKAIKAPHKIQKRNDV